MARLGGARHGRAGPGAARHGKAWHGLQWSKKEDYVMETVKEYRIRIKGITALLHHADNVEWADAMEAWRNNPKNKARSKAGDDRTPGFMWIGNLYHDGKRIVIPADNIMVAYRGAGARVPVPGGRSGKTFKQQTQSGMSIKEIFVPLLINGKTIPVAKILSLAKEESFVAHAKLVKSLGFALDVRRAKIRSSKHIRVRPRFDSWEAKFTLSVWDKQITGEIISTLSTFAGSYQGLCDWRPSSASPGAWGRFEAKVEHI